MRIQGDVYNRFFSEDMTWHICHKVLHTGGYIVCSISRREHFVGLKIFATPSFLPSLRCMLTRRKGTSWLSLRPFLLKFTGELYDFTSDGCQFECQFLQLGKHGEGFFLGEITLQSDYSLIIIHSNTAKLPVQIRQFLVIIEQ